MKKSILVLILSVFTLSAFSQNEIRKKFYFDNSWNIVDSRNEATYSRSVKFYDDDELLKYPLGTVKTYYVNSGNLFSKTKYYLYDPNDELNCNPTGLKTIYFDSEENRKWKIISYYKGNKDGEEVVYWENGNIKSKANYAFNKLHGKYISYNSFGKKIKVTTYANGLENGQIILYEEDGITPKIINHATNGKINKWSEKKGLVPGQTIIFFRDDFQDNRYDWNLSPTKFNVEIESGKLKVETPVSNSDVQYWYPSVIPLENSNVYSETFVLETRYKIESDNNQKLFGILLGFDSWQTYYSIIMFKQNEEGLSYKMKKVVDGLKFVETDWQKTSKETNYFKNEYNTIQLRQWYSDEDEEWKMSIVVNGEIQYPALKSPRNFGNDIGFSTYSSSNVEVDYLEVRYDRYDEGNKDFTVNKCAGSGTGFAINEKGYIATNYHVIGECENIFIMSNQSDEEVKAKVILRDKQNDLAILKIDNYIPEIPYSFEEESKVLEQVYAYGYPLTYALGDNIKATDGTVSSLSGANDDNRIILHTAPIQPGNSGGPLFNKNGNIVGVNTAYYPNAENVSVSMKIKLLIDHMNTINISKPKDNRLSYIIDRSGQYEVIKDYVYRVIIKE